MEARDLPDGPPFTGFLRYLPSNCDQGGQHVIRRRTFDRLDDLEKRLEGIRRLLMGAHGASEILSSASKGAERELFLSVFLKQVLPPNYRFSSGEIISTIDRKKSGQLDLIMALPFLPSFPIPGLDQPRLHLAEGVACAIEVKSDLRQQWRQVEATGASVVCLKRNDPTAGSVGSFPGIARTRVPFFAVGYKGWKSLEGLSKKVLESQSVDAALILSDPGLFCCKGDFGDSATGPGAVGGFLEAMRRVSSSVIAGGIGLRWS
jgi:hypothetical protein